MSVVARALCVFLVLLGGAAIGCAGGEGTVSDTASTTPKTSTTSPVDLEDAGVVDPALADRARGLVTLLHEGRFDEATVLFDEPMLAALPATKLEEAWDTVEVQAGPFQETEDVRLAREQGYDVALVRTRFEKATLDVRVVFGPDGRVAGLFFLPAASSSGTPVDYVAPDYVHEDVFNEEEVTVGAPGWLLPATLTMPVGPGPFPGLVLVHGSGPHDRDETIGPNKPFRDLAWGLASRGIVVLRYEKRTKEYAVRMGEDLAAITVDAETVDDAVTAIEALRGRPDVAGDRVGLLGHSLGGYLAPRIAARDPSLAGLVLLAASARPLEDLALEQTTYLVGLDGTVTADEEVALSELRDAVERVKDPGLSTATDPSLLPFGIPPSYWLDLRGYDPVATAAGLGVPILVLQGGRDYQVAEADFALWRAGLGDGPLATFVRYDDLNHLFMVGEGPSVPAEYDVPGHVDQAVVEDVTDWIMR